MAYRHTLLLAALALPCALAGCGRNAGEREPVLEPDPAIVAALAQPLMTDPDLAAMNGGNAAITLTRFDGNPAWTRDPDELAAARAAAVRLADGQMQTAPEPTGAEAPAAVRSARQFAADHPGASGQCRSALRPGFAWAADLPRAASLYPSSHVVEALGASRPDCAMRAVRYVTAASRQDVLDFHFSLLVRGGYEVERATGADADLLTARKSGAVARMLIASVAEGMTEVVLATTV